MYENFIKSGIIQPSELNALLQDGKNLCLVDASYVLPGNPSPRESWKQARIGDAVFFSIEEIADHSSPLPQMLPTVKEFEKQVSVLGISNSDLVVIYGQNGTIMGPARAWWMFRVFGHEKVCVLDGGLPAWKKVGFPLNSALSTAPAPGVFKANFQKNLVQDIAGMKAVVKNKSTLIYDARAEGRFAGREPEPRPGLRGGHIPGSYNIPAGTLIDPETGRIKSDAELDTIFAKAEFSAGSPVYATCGSGVTACMIALALHKRGCPGVSVYDGAWAEWGAESSGLPVETV